jgi:tetratricopeptide (TPR) repeat protein
MNPTLRSGHKTMVLTLSLALGASPAFAKKKHATQPADSAAPATAPATAGGGMTFEPEAVGNGDDKAPPAAKPTTKKGARAAAVSAQTNAAATKVLERALKLYDAEDYTTATIELNKVVEGQSGDDDANRQKAEFYMAKALYNMRYYSASLNYFDRVVQKGPEHRYYNKTLVYLAKLSSILPESAGVLEKIGKYTRADLDQPALEGSKDELYYLLGRYNYAKGNFKEAIELFSAVPDRSDVFIKAKFYEGITWVRQNKGKEASDSFKEILRKVRQYPKPDKLPPLLKEYETLANISLGRVFYTTGQYLNAIKYYEKIPQESPDWLPSLFEASWAYFQIDGDSKALGNIHSINSPFFEKEFYPEASILKAVIYFYRCNYDRALEAVNEFSAVYPQLQKDIEDVINKVPDDAQFYDYVVKIQKGESGLNERVERAAAGVLNDRTLQKNIDFVVELSRELKTLDKADPAWKSTAVAGNILQDLTLNRSLAQGEAGRLARSRLNRLASEIQEQVKNSIKVEYEALQAQKGTLTAGLANEQSVSMNPNAKNYNTIQIDDEHQQWPFKGEYWKDELGYYRFKVANKCQAPQGAKPSHL